MKTIQEFNNGGAAPLIGKPVFGAWLVLSDKGSTYARIQVRQSRDRYGNVLTRADILCPMQDQRQQVKCAGNLSQALEGVKILGVAITRKGDWATQLAEHGHIVICVL